jgi:orotidine-5'-phosphate decarboxylase
VSPARAGQLPNYQTFEQLLARHDAKLHDIRWTMNNACRSVGGVAVDEANEKPIKTAQAAVAR